VPSFEQSFDQHLFDRIVSQIHRKGQTMAIAVVIPGRFRPDPLGPGRPVAQVYARRRLAVLLILTAIVLVLLVGTGRVVANRGGAPASASAIRPESPQAAPGATGAAPIYVVQPGDTLWSIGERFHGSTPLVDYVDHLVAMNGGTPLADYVDGLVAANGGTELQVSQALALP